MNGILPPSSSPVVAGLALAALLGPAGLAGDAVAPPARPLPAQQACPAADSLVERGWDAFRQGEIELAGERFDRVLARCPGHLGSRVGAGYVALRAGDDQEARRRFRSVLEGDSTVVDALVGLGILAWRAGDLERVSELFQRVQRFDPDNATAGRYLARLPEGLGPAPRRPPLQPPDTVVHPARARGDGFQVRTEEGWRTLYVRGVNLGAALPGKFPSQFPDAEIYRSWVRKIGRMEANAIRLYTIHPPAFYEALAAYNRAHPDDSLWLIHGVWTELPPDDDYDDPDFRSGFRAEMRRVVDVVHGRADLRPRPGHASGHYVADVSPWTLAFVLGREWEPYSVTAYEERASDRAGAWSGDYLRVEDGSAMEIWLARAMEEMIRYETERYHTQRPVAFTNWPTLDPLDHPTETTVSEELALRRALGETVETPPRELNNDAVSVDPGVIRRTADFAPGTFAVYHAYPYYPDFMVLDPGYRRACSPFGPSNYFAYLRELKAYHEDIPVLVGEYGVPASLGSAHLQPQGWHHGGHAEAEMAEIDVRLTREIRAAGMAGGIVFAWIDEWFKKNWLVTSFEIPGDRNRLWWNRLDPEQHYGMIAMEPEPPVAGDSLPRRLEAWREVEPILRGSDGTTLSATADAAHLWLLVHAPRDRSPGEVQIGFDMVRPEGGDHRLPHGELPRLDVGLEFALRASGGEVRLVADPPSNPFRLEPVRSGLPGDPVVPEIDDPPAGFFSARIEQRFNDPYISVENADGRYDSLRVVTNRPRFSRDTVEFAALGYDRGLLPRGGPPDGYWQRSEDGRALEIRVPWNLLNVTDPSQRRVLQSTAGSGQTDADTEPGGFGTERVEDVGMVLAVRSDDGGWELVSGDDGPVARYAWPTWDEPEWRSRARPVYGALRRLFDEWDDGTRAPAGCGQAREGDAAAACARCPEGAEDR